MMIWKLCTLTCGMRGNVHDDIETQSKRGAPTKKLLEGQFPAARCSKKASVVCRIEIESAAPGKVCRELSTILMRSRVSGDNSDVENSQLVDLLGVGVWLRSAVMLWRANGGTELIYPGSPKQDSQVGWRAERSRGGLFGSISGELSRSSVTKYALN